MKIISREQEAHDVILRWKEQYYHNGKWKYNEDFNKSKVYEQLKLLESKGNVTADNVDNIIGNKYWTSCQCQECMEYKEVIIQLGEEPDYDSRTFYICKDCLLKTFKMI